MRLRYLTLLLLFAVSLLKAQTGIHFNEYNNIDQQVKDFMATWNIQGGSVAITKNGKLVYNKGFGFSDQRSTTPAQPNDLYRIASVSKPVTAIAIMKLVEQGEISLDDKVFGKGRLLEQDYYKKVIVDLRIYDITVRHLLEHTAGWDRNQKCDGYSHTDPAFFPLHVTNVEDEPNPVGDSTLIRFSLQKGLHHEPGTKFSYSNIGYLVLGKIIERVSGMNYENYLQENIFAPLGIHDIRLGKNLLENKFEREAEYISDETTLSCYGDGNRVPWQYGGFNLEAMNAHGGLIASASDLSKLILAVDGLDTYPDILRSSSIQEMTKGSNINPNYAKGWAVSKNNNWWHTGSLDGSASFVCRTNNGYTWAFLFNSRANNSAAFWNALDKLPWNCLKSTPSFPEIDLFAPEKNVTDLSAHVLKNGLVKLQWKSGSGDGRLLVISESADFNNAFPVNGQTYKTNSVIGQNASPHKAITLYNGKGNQCIVSNLNPSKTYYIRAFEYYKKDNTGNSEVYTLGESEIKVISVNDILANQSL